MQYTIIYSFHNSKIIPIFKDVKMEVLESLVHLLKLSLLGRVRDYETSFNQGGSMRSPPNQKGLRTYKILKHEKLLIRETN